jgi:hypothetical protein
MKKDFETILDESLSRLKQKEGIEACLGRYPQYADQLEPLLRTTLKVEVLKDTEPPSAKAMAAGRERFLQEASRLQAERALAYKLAKGPARRRRLMLSMAATILVALLLALAALARFEAPDTIRRLYHWWRTPGPQPTMTQPATDIPWPTITPSHTPTATHTHEPTDTPQPTPTLVPTATSELGPMESLDGAGDDSGADADDDYDAASDDDTDEDVDDEVDDEADEAADDDADDSDADDDRDDDSGDDVDDDGDTDSNSGRC